jgi:PHD/YefM family antitoxin component YafN of YafNO toxin-antitoxin module
MTASTRPVVLTVKGKAAAVVQDAEAYQRLLDIAAGDGLALHGADGVTRVVEILRRELELAMSVG